MRSTTASFQPGASTSTSSTMASHTPSTPSATGHKPNLTLQESLQDTSIRYWRKPIDEALELHLHGRHVTTRANRKTLAADSWTKWSQKFCREMLKLVPLVSAAQANELLTAKMATSHSGERDKGMGPWVVRYAVADVRKRLEKKTGGPLGNGGKVQGRMAPMQSHWHVYACLPVPSK